MCHLSIEYKRKHTSLQQFHQFYITLVQSWTDVRCRQIIFCNVAVLEKTEGHTRSMVVNNKILSSFLKVLQLQEGWLISFRIIKTIGDSCGL